MASPMAMIGMGASALGGVFGAAGAETSAAGKQLDIQGAMLKTVGQAYGEEVQAQQYGYQASVEDYQAGVAEVNRQIAMQNADYSREVGEVQADQEGLKVAAGVAQAKVAQGSSGIDINSGSSVNVRQSMISLGQYGQQVIRANAAKVAYNYDVEATMDSAQRDLHTYAAGEDRTQQANALTAVNLTMSAIPLEESAFSLAGKAGDIAAAGSLVGAAGSVASKWTQGSTMGLT